MAERVTSIDVAKLAGASQPTVSRVYRADASVSADKDERVRAAACLGYKPNTLARSLTSGRSRAIGIVLAYLDNPFYTEALQRLSEALSAQDYHVMVFFAANLEEEIDPVIEGLAAHQVEGIILASVSLSNQLTARIKDLSIPFVLFNRGQEAECLPSVTAKNFEGGARLRSSWRMVSTDGLRIFLVGRDRKPGVIGSKASSKRCAIEILSRLLASTAILSFVALRALLKVWPVHIRFPLFQILPPTHRDFEPCRILLNR